MRSSDQYVAESDYRRISILVTDDQLMLLRALAVSRDRGENVQDLCNLAVNELLDNWLKEEEADEANSETAETAPGQAGAPDKKGARAAQSTNKSPALSAQLDSMMD